MEALGADDPRRVGEYVLLRRLGAGGMGRVYLGRTAGGRTVAVKTVRPEFAGDADFRDRFRREVAAARRVAGRWTAPVLDADTEGARPWVATGYVPGPDLTAAVREFGPLPPDAVRTLGAGLAEALHAMHAQQLVHRDVKPSNVLLTLDGPRLIDFGITRALDATTAVTRTGLVVGSPGYLGPEQARGERAGPPADVFSLGAVLAYALTGRPPFGESPSSAVLMYRVLGEEPDLDGVHGPLRELVTACLAKEPADRPTAAEVRERLGGADPLDTGGGWLPPHVSAALARQAVALLDLDADPEPPADVPGPHVYVPGPGFGPPPVWTTQERTTPPPPPVRGRRRGVVVTAVAGVLVLVLTGVIATLVKQANTHHSSGGTPSPSRSASASRSASPSPSPSVLNSAAWEVPPQFIGSWRGRLRFSGDADGGTLDLVVTQGHSGDVVGTFSTPDGGDETCRLYATLLVYSPTSMSMEEKKTGASDECEDSDEDTQFNLTRVGARLHIVVISDDGGPGQGDLTRRG